MKRSLIVFATLLASTVAGQVRAQYDYQPPSVPSSYSEYDYYAGTGRQPSPSDVPMEDSNYQAATEYSDEGYSACDDLCDSYCDPCEPWRLFPELPCGTTITGWVDSGGTANADSPASRFNGPVRFNDRDEFQVNQVYGILQRPIDTSYWSFDIGGRVDVLFGTDYIFTQAVGLETRDDAVRANDPAQQKWNNRRLYGLAMPQAYGEVGWNDLSVKVGHFYSPLGYDRVMSPYNFFYSHSYTHQYGEPFTYTGALASYAVTDQLVTYSGVHNGWDVFDRYTERAGLLSGFSWSNYDNTFMLNVGVTTGDELNDQLIYSNRTLYSVVAMMKLTERLDYVLQHDNGWQKDYFAPGVDAEWYGINNNLFYTLNPCWKFGARYEWFRDDDGVRVTGIRPTNPINGASFVGDFHQISLGMNWIPTNNLRVRPEVRWDWFDGAGLPYDDQSEDDQFLGAVDAVLLW